MSHSAPTSLRATYLEDGYAQLNAFLDTSAVKELDGKLKDFINTKVPTLSSEQVFYENKIDHITLKQIQHLELHDNWFHSLFTDSPFRRLAEALLGGECVPMNMQYFNKPPGTNKATPAHQVSIRLLSLEGRYNAAQAAQHMIASDIDELWANFI